MSAIAPHWAEWMLERGIAATIALVAVFLVSVAMRRKASAHALSHLALLPLVLLVVPLERMLPALDIGLGFSTPRFAVAIEADAGSARPGVPPSVAALEASKADADADAGLRDESLAAAVGAISRDDARTNDALVWLFVLWCAGVAASLAHFARRELRGRRFLARRSHVASVAATRRFERLRLRSGVRTSVRLRVVPGLASPATGGLLRPVVYVPPLLFERLPARELAWVLLHELAHVRRRDVRVALFERCVLAAWFFHPAAWIARALAARWREQACDEAALACLGTRARRASASALFRVLSLSGEAPQPQGALASLHSSRSFVRTRLMRLLDSRRVPARRLSFAGRVSLALGVSAVLVIARSRDAAPALAVQDAATPSARTSAALWLARHQASDGRWTVSSNPEVRTQGELNEIGVTALAVRALLGELRVAPQAELEASLGRGVAFLEGAQTADGCFGPKDIFATIYAQAYALHALCEVDAHRPDPARREKLERCVRFLEKARNPYRGWRYDHVPTGDNDSKITSAVLIALREAEQRGVEVDPAAFHGGISLLDELTFSDTGRTGFVQRDSPAPRFAKKAKKFPAKYSEEPTAMALLVRLSIGETSESSVLVQRGLALVAEKLPQWSEALGSIDYAYWMSGAAAMARGGGDAANAWRAALHEALLPHRVIDADGSAHWPAIDAWSEPGFESYATASALLALQAL